jgi:hypothetical protein
MCPGDGESHALNFVERYINNGDDFTHRERVQEAELMQPRLLPMENVRND